MIKMKDQQIEMDRLVWNDDCAKRWSSLFGIANAAAIFDATLTFPQFYFMYCSKPNAIRMPVGFYFYILVSFWTECGVCVARVFMCRGCACANSI